MARGHNKPNAPDVPDVRATGPHPDWNAVEWWVYRTPAVGGGYSYRVTARKLSPGELYGPGEELACTVSRCSLAAVRAHLRDGVSTAHLQGVIDEAENVQQYRKDCYDAPFRERMAERRAKAQAEFEARRLRAEQRLAEDVARAAPTEAA